MTDKQNPIFPEDINKTSENPLKEFFLLLAGISAILVFLLILINVLVVQLAPHIPYQWERNVFANFQLESGDEQAPKQRALKAMLASIMPHIEGMQASDIQVHYVDEDIPNAFASLGGNIVIYQGLLDEVSSENALMMVLTHEIAHVKLRHPIQSVSSGVLFQLVLSSVGVGVDAASGVINNAGLLTLLSFGREMETEADRLAVASMISYYGHLNGADEFFVKMSKASTNSRWLTAFESHPNINDRIAALSTPTSVGELTPLSEAF